MSKAQRDLCEECKEGIDLDILQDKAAAGGFNIHPTFSSFRASVERGCPVCAAVWNVYERSDEYGLFKHDLTPYIYDETGVSVWCSFKEKWVGTAPTTLRWELQVPGKERVLIGKLVPFVPEGSPLADHLPSRPIAPDCSSPAAVARMKHWLTTCVESHPKCHQDAYPTPPMRLIDVGTDTSPPKLVETKGTSVKWAALSHCWGGIVPIQTLSSNLQTHLASITLSTLPRNFRDAITITRQLGIPYLWIDSLCIIQDSPTDWLANSTKLHCVYREASFTISAESAANSLAGICASSRAPRSEIALPFSIGGRAEDGKIKGEIGFHTPFPCAIDDHGLLSNRAWVLQEELLARRLLRFAPHQMYWRCRTSRVSENDIHGVGPDANWDHECMDLTLLSPLAELRIRNEEMGMEWCDRMHLSSAWFQVVNEYFLRGITYQSDRMPAVSALARTFAELHGWEYVAGLWREGFAFGLLWDIHSPGCEGTEGYVAPSWSWASVKGKERVDLGMRTKGREGLLYFVDPYGQEEAEDFRVVGVDLRLVDGDMYGRLGPESSVTVSGRCVETCRCRILPTTFDIFAAPVVWGEDDIDRRYEDVFRETEVECGEEGNSLHGKLVLLHVGQCTFPGMDYGEAAEDVVRRSRPQAWCLILRPRATRPSEYSRVGLVKVEDLGVWLKGSWTVRTLKLF